jgi:hypothetical protein
MDVFDVILFCDNTLIIHHSTMLRISFTNAVVHARWHYYQARPAG